MSFSSIKAELLPLLKEAFPTASTLDIEDNGQCESAKIQITIVDASFEGLSKLKRHQRVNKVVTPFIDDGRVHAANYVLKEKEEH